MFSNATSQRLKELDEAATRITEVLAYLNEISEILNSSFDSKSENSEPKYERC